MAILEVLTYPNPTLKKRALPVDKVTEELVQLAHDMLETMYNAPGVGLAANQVGVLKRLIVIDTRSKLEDGSLDEDAMTELERKVNYPLIIFNPVIKMKEGEICYEEGCLSVPGFLEEVERAEYVEVGGLNERGEEVLIKTDGLLSICLQHEMDHLEGYLFIDRLSMVRRNMIKSKIKKFGYPDKKERAAVL